MLQTKELAQERHLKIYNRTKLNHSYEYKRKWKLQCQQATETIQFICVELLRSTKLTTSIFYTDLNMFWIWILVPNKFSRTSNIGSKQERIKIQQIYYIVSK